MNKPLSEERFRELLDAYGAEISRFPEPERRAAELLLDSSESARAWFDAERELDARLLKSLSAALEPLSPELERRLAGIPIRHPQAGRGGGLVRLFVPAVAWAAAACVGIWLGSGALPIDDDAGSSDESAELQSDEEELVALAIGDEEGFEVWP
jgi:hypothetical protein